MAKLVTIIGITHNPFMPRLFQQPQQPPGAAKVKERIAMMRDKLAEARPDVLVTIGVYSLAGFEVTPRRPSWSMNCCNWPLGASMSRRMKSSQML